MAKTKRVRSHKGQAEKLQALAREKFEGMSVGEAVKKAGVSNATYHRWKNALWDQVTEAHLNPSAEALSDKTAAKQRMGMPGKKAALVSRNGKGELGVKDRVAELEAENLQLRLTIADMALEARHPTR